MNSSKITAGSVVIFGLDALLFLFIGITSVLGFTSAYSDLKIATKLWEFVCCGVVFTYGVAGFVALIRLIRRRRWALWFLYLWASSMSVAAGMATIVYGESSLSIGIVASASILLIVVPAIYWAIQRINRSNHTQTLSS